MSTNNSTTYQSILSTINRLFRSVDSWEWDEVAGCFAKEVLLDYSSMSGEAPVRLSPQDIVNNWRALLPGFQATHHQLGNFEVNVRRGEATVFCYGTADHYLPNDQGGDLWQVTGSYDFHLVGEGEHWKIDQMKFNFKFQQGNAELPALAQQRVKEQM